VLKYEEQILHSFERLGKKPRGDQVKYVNQIIEAYLDDGKTNVILCAPTGSGKSIIGAIVADAIHHILEIFERNASFILTGTNVLTDQYAETFDGVRDFLLVKGANNYECEVLDETAGSCCEKAMRKSKEPDLVAMADKFCGKCEFASIKKRKHVAEHLITNYSYFFIDRLFTNQHAYRTITVWDEAHLISDAFAEHCAVYVSEKRLTGFVLELVENLKLDIDNSLLKSLNDFKKHLSKGTINDDNYLSLLEALHSTYKAIEERATDSAKQIIRTDLTGYSKLSRLGKKYGDLACKIGDLLAYQYEHVFEYNKEAKELSVKPIFVGSMFNTLINSDFQLFMSATVSETLLVETLGLNPVETKFIKLPPSFPIENKKVVFLGVEKLNYTTMKDVAVQKKLANACKKLVARHGDEGESGIILTPSFDVTEQIANAINFKNVEVFQHERGTKLAPLVESFKRFEGPAVLISPSMFEGLSLDDDLSRYQILVKSPYASLGEKRMKYIADHHPNMYQLATILKIIQGAGRSVRSEEDFAVTYCLDQQLSWLWKSNLNVWKDEFSVSFQ